jgi:hypothetical protein
MIFNLPDYGVHAQVTCVRAGGVNQSGVLWAPLRSSLRPDVVEAIDDTRAVGAEKKRQLPEVGT